MAIICPHFFFASAKTLVLYAVRFSRNGGTSNGRADGFSLETLTQVEPPTLVFIFWLFLDCPDLVFLVVVEVSNTKSSEGSLTLLSYIVGYSCTPAGSINFP